MSAFIDCVPNKQPLSANEALCEAEAEIRHVYVPVTAGVSLVSSLQSGVGAEVAVVGHEGVVRRRRLHGRPQVPEPRRRATCRHGVARRRTRCHRPGA